MRPQMFLGRKMLKNIGLKGRLGPQINGLLLAPACLGPVLRTVFLRTILSLHTI